jgi:predicted RND superfamily exporter protein
MKIGHKIVNHRRVILLVAIILLIPAFMGFKRTNINYDMLTYLPKDMETVKGQDLLMNDFDKGGFSIIVIENMKSSQVDALKDDIQKIDHVADIVSLEDVLNPTIPREMLPKKVADNLNNKDATLLGVFFDTSTSDEKTLEAVEKIREIGNKDTYVSGLSPMVIDLRNLCEEEEPKYVALAVTLSLIAMMLLLDSYFAPILFLMSIGAAILYNFGTNIFLGEISYITKAIAAVLQLGVTMDYSIFLWHSYTDQRDAGLDDDEAMAIAIDNTLVSVTGSSITTVAGFLALCFMTYTMGKDLGIVMAKGVILGVISSITILPALLLQFKKILRKTMHKALIPDVHKLAHGLTSRYVIYILIFAVTLGVAVYGYRNQNIIYDFSKMMSGKQSDIDKNKTEFMIANDKLRDNFNISTSYMVLLNDNISPADGNAMVKQIEDLDGIVNVLGIQKIVGNAIPKEVLPERITSAVASKGHQMIVINSEYRVSTDKCNEQIDKVNEIAKAYDPKSTVIGEAPATKDLIKLTDKDFKLVNWISIAMVFLIILIVLRSFSLPFILVAVIEFAIIVNLGIPGYTGLELPFIVPICISTIQLGSTVDYAILMSTKYKEERFKGLEKRAAIIEAAALSIPSILVSALGFFTATIGVAIYSNIGIISVMCSLMARGAIISMLTVILVLPSLLMLLDKVICKTTKGMSSLVSK